MNSMTRDVNYNSSQKESVVEDSLIAELRSPVAAVGRKRNSQLRVTIGASPSPFHP